MGVNDKSSAVSFGQTGKEQFYACVYQKGIYGKFWSEVEKVLPDYKAQVKWLKDEGGNIMRRNG